MSGNKDKNDKTQGEHLLADLFGVEDPNLTDSNHILALFEESASDAGLPSSGQSRIFPCAGENFTGYIHLKESNSHISFNAFPDQQYLTIDILVFGNADPEKLFSLLLERFSAVMVRKTIINRGLVD